MKFAVLVAADLYGNKVNLELTFPGFPSLQDLTRMVETTFAVESSSLRPTGQPFIPFKAVRFVIFDDNSRQWQDLGSPNQLSEYCQVYAIQRDAVETQRHIPPARLPVTLSNSPNRNIISTPRSADVVQYSHAPTITSDTLQQPSARSHSNTKVPRAFSEVASFEQKIRTVFEEMDGNQNRVVSSDDFRRALRMLSIDLSVATVNDLFHKADADRDSVVSFSEFERFSYNYPTLLDSMYFRNKEYYEDQRRKKKLDLQRLALEESIEKERAVSVLQLEGRKAIEEQELRMTQVEQDLQGRLLKERESRAQHLEAKRESERQLLEKNEKEKEVTQAKERERGRHQQLAEAQKATEAVQRKQSAVEADLLRCQEKEKQLEALLAEARRETERQGQLVLVAADDTRRSHEREQQQTQLFNDVQREMQRILEGVSLSERELARRKERERDSEAVLSETQRETARCAQRRDEEEREMGTRRERDSNLCRSAQDANRGFLDQQQCLVSLEEDYAAYIARRQQIEQQELPLLEQEIRLREQRYALEEKETRLKTEAISFQSVSGRSPAARHETSSLPTASPVRR